MREISVRSILVATALADGSDEVVRAGAMLARRAGAQLHLVHALEDQGRPFGELGFNLFSLQRRIDDARALMQQQVGRVVPPDVSVASLSVEHQPAHIAIGRRAREADAGLIVLGPHRGRLRGSYLLGTTAQRVVQEAAAPCLVAREELVLPLRKVLLPVGQADVARGLLPTAAAWLAGLRRTASGISSERCDVRVLHVVRSADQWRDFSAELAQAIREAGENPAVEAQLRLRRAVAWSRTTGEEIAQIANRSGVDLVAMGVCERGPLLHAALGSVSTVVLKQCAAPVLLFPPQVCELGGRVPGEAVLPEPLAR